MCEQSVAGQPKSMVLALVLVAVCSPLIEMECEFFFTAEPCVKWDCPRLQGALQDKCLEG